MIAEIGREEPIIDACSPVSRPAWMTPATSPCGKVADIAGVVHRQYGKLGLAYLRQWLATFAEIKDDPDLGRPFEAALKTAAAAAAKRTKPR